jgi:hypothetical protein
MIIFRHVIFKLICNIFPPEKFLPVFYVSKLCSEHFHAHTTRARAQNTRRRSDVNLCAEIPEISFHAPHERNAVQAYIAYPVLVPEYYRTPSEVSGRKEQVKGEAERTHIHSPGILCSSLNMHPLSLFVN